ncbi:adenylyl-sulfate kinase [Massilia sp. GCM10020059]|uniref:Adenylyl-sulfate kinase n=1 Tax=Massilia agrisoli TaxID=2892444 RepID=A0ABS8IPL0_9BURK|nr:adenylyl-sulfate kinase [Massilia agrisoli]MCC6070133.1 adenylyl-sulfate kinase [Massilia agrisoli]
MTISAIEAAPYCLWMTGLSGAGKSTLAQALFAELQQRGTRAFVLDGDHLRQGLCADLGFSAADRHENIRRAGAVARLMFDAGLVVICAFVSPFAADRDRVRRLFPAGRFVEVYLSTPLATCAARDPKGLYARAARDATLGLTGVQAPYEPPAEPELTLDTSMLSVPASLSALLALSSCTGLGPQQAGSRAPPAWADQLQ